jgi:HNH endonuclease
MRYQPLRERFEAKISPEPLTGCWLWTGAVTTSKNTYPYGSIKTDRRDARPQRLEAAHRVAWLLYRGPIPDGLDVLHKCDQPYCVNPDHLFIGTHAENMADMVRKGRSNARPGQLAHATLNAVIAQQIRDRRAAGERPTALAREFGISRQQVHRIYVRKCWSDS